MDSPRKERPRMGRSADWSLVAIDDDNNIARLTLPESARAHGYLDLDAAEAARLISLLGVIALTNAERNDALNEPLTDAMVKSLIEIASAELALEVEEEVRRRMKPRTFRPYASED